MTVPSHLRPLGIGELIDRAFRIYRAHVVMFLGIAAVALIPTAVLRIISLIAFDTDRLIGLGEQYFVQSLASVALALAVSRTYLWQTLTISDAYRLGLRRYVTFLLASLLEGLAIGVPVILLVMCSLTAGSTGGYCMLAFLFILIALPVAYVVTRWGVVLPCVVLEDSGAAGALRRSWHLTAGHFWRVFGTSIAVGILTLVVATLPGWIITTAIELVISSDLLRAMLYTLTNQASLIITLPFGTAVTTLLYYDLRVRKEGYDLELMAQEIAAS